MVCYSERCSPNSHHLILQWYPLILSKVMTWDVPVLSETHIQYLWVQVKSNPLNMKQPLVFFSSRVDMKTSRHETCDNATLGLREGDATDGRGRAVDVLDVLASFNGHATGA